MKPFQHTFQVNRLGVHFNDETDDQTEMSLLEQEPNPLLPELNTEHLTKAVQKIRWHIKRMMSSDVFWDPNHTGFYKLT